MTMDQVNAVLETIAASIEVFGIAILIFAALKFTAHFLSLLALGFLVAIRIVLSFFLGRELIDVKGQR